MTLADRRKGIPRKTISQILEEMQVIADKDFGGDLQKYGLEILQRFSESDQKTFLRKSLMLHWERQIDLARSDLSDIVLGDEVRIDPVAVERERLSIDELNQAELIKLKTWLHKALFTIAAIGFVIIVAVAYFTESLVGNAKDIMEILTDVVKIIFD